jgi:hypothetical protein
VQVGGTFLVGWGIDEIKESMKIIFSCPKPFDGELWMIDG